uniref:Uncharacterized protein n=1 Tax=Avena sativa TaxID=4498 RepID=A0ACD5U2J9_AVESA
MEEDPMAVALPEDALAEILRRLPLRSLATSRCVCKAWCAIVDGRRLLLRELLPHSVRGIFLKYTELPCPAFLSHPCLEPNILGKLNFHRLPSGYSRASILDHCNGLLLYKDLEGLHVSNPATQWRASLPPPPLPPPDRFHEPPHLVFDPRESLHYEVLLVPECPLIEERDEPSKEWPASVWVLCAFSSRTGQWEERAFVREGEAAGMASEEVLQRSNEYGQNCSAYWHGALFVQSNGGFTVMRICLSNNKYRVIKMPTDIGEIEYYDVYLGRSKGGLCCASFHDWHKLRVWILDDSGGTIEWVLKHHIDLHNSVASLISHLEENNGPWILEDGNSGEHYGQQNLQDVNTDEDHNNNALVKSKVEWDSDNDNIVDNESEVVQRFWGYITVLGFHPYKDVIFLNISLDRALAYHLDTSTVQDLGKIRPNGYYSHVAGITSSFPYTPCLITDFPENKLEAFIEG